MNKNSNAEPSAGRIRYSITNKLNSKLFFRLLRLFISINIIICIIAAVGLTVYCERVTLATLETLEEHGVPEGVERFTLAEISVREISEYSVDAAVDWPWSRLLPRETETAVRGFRAEAGRFRETIRSIQYIVNVGMDGKLYEVSMRIGPFILYFIYAFMALCVYELLSLLTRSAKDRRMVRRTLDPITEFARAASSLTSASRNLEHDLEHEKVMALAGRLDGLDVSRLDTRIQVDDLQEELRNVAIAINGMLDRINEAYATQARFVSDASHELRTPISVIQGYANLLDRWGKEDEKTLTESIAAIKDEAGNMKELVEQLLFLARGDSNTIRLEEEKVSLPELIEEVVAEMRMLNVGREFKANSENLAIIADRSLIKQALRILVDNAVKYTDDGGEITISASAGDQGVKLAVSDNGVGISPEILPRVFDRFVRADESRARKTGGAGLGLSIAQWIAIRHNGHMEVLSREGVGTRMTLVIPLPRQVLDIAIEPDGAADAEPGV